ncbi:MAG: heparan-alpha-glucosaminide N-acetyltransferase domain-containing protein [Planctomycetota bacterium]
MPRPEFAGVRAPRQRLTSIDALRGIVMVLMVLDHARDFFGLVDVDPTDFDTTTPALFLTRWVTHFCAPTFVFLAGVGAFMLGRRLDGPGELSRHLFVRGLWLVVLEFTIVTFAWTNTFDGPLWYFQVIAAIGAAMVGMSVLVLLPPFVVAAIGLAVVFGHDAIRPWLPEAPGSGSDALQVLFGSRFGRAASRSARTSCSCSTRSCRGSA